MHDIFRLDRRHLSNLLFQLQFSSKQRNVFGNRFYRDRRNPKTSDRRVIPQNRKSIYKRVTKKSRSDRIAEAVSAATDCPMGSLCQCLSHRETVAFSDMQPSSGLLESPVVAMVGVRFVGNCCDRSTVSTSFEGHTVSLFGAQFCATNSDCCGECGYFDAPY